MKKVIALTVATSMTMVTMPTTAKASSIFVDIDTVPWPEAATAINKAYDYRLLHGYEIDGEKYVKPNLTLPYSQAVQLVYSIMKMYHFEDVSDEVVAKWQHVMDAYTIAEWVQPATAYCLEASFISANDLTKVRDDNTAITREEVAVLFGKALTTIYGNPVSTSLPYNDKGDIISDNVPYIALLYSKNIMIGDAEGNFRPKESINRAEMAVLTVNAYEAIAAIPYEPVVPTIGTMTGKVTSTQTMTNRDVFLTIIDNFGMGESFLGSGADVEVTYNRQDIDFEDIKVGDTVTVTFDTNGLRSVNIVNSLNGLFIADPDTGLDLGAVIYNCEALTSTKITVVEGTQKKIFDLATSVTVYINKERETIAILRSALEYADYNVTLILNSAGDVTQINAVKSSNNPLTGELKYIDSNTLEIAVATQRYDYPISGTSFSVTQNGKDYNLQVLKSEYQSKAVDVTLTLNGNGEVVNINIDRKEDDLNGVLYHMNNRRLTLIADGVDYEYLIDISANVFVDDKEMDINDVIDMYSGKNYNVSLELNAVGYASEIYLSTKQATSAYGDITYLSSSTIKIYYNNQTYEYDLSTSPRITIDGTTVSLATLKEYYRTYDYAVNLEFNTRGEVSTITGKNTEAYKGTVRNILPERGEIQIVAGGVRYTYLINQDVYVKIDGNGGYDTYDIENIFTGLTSSEYITASLELDALDKVTILLVDVFKTTTSTNTQNVTGEYRDMDFSEGIVKIYYDGDTHIYNLLSSAESNLTLNGNSATKTQIVRIGDYNDVADNETFKLTLHLNTNKEVTAIDANVVTNVETDGELTYVDAKNGYLELQGSYSGEIFKFNTSDVLRISYELPDNDYDYNSGDFGDDIYDLAALYTLVQDKRDDIYLRVYLDDDGDVYEIKAEVIA